MPWALKIIIIAVIKFLQKLLDPSPDPDYHQNAIVSSMTHVSPFYRTLGKSVE